MPAGHFRRCGSCSPGHLAFLPAHAASEAASVHSQTTHLLADCPPVSVQHIQLYDQRSGHKSLPHFHWDTLSCEEAAPSPCGSYLAVWLKGLQHGPACYDESIHDVMIYDTKDGFREIVQFCTGRLEPDIKWSSSVQLCVAQLLDAAPGPHDACSDAGIGAPTEAAAAFIYDPKAAAVVCSLGSEASGTLRTLGQGHCTSTAWAPSSRCLLVLGVHLGNPGVARVPGWLAIADVVHGQVIAHCTVTVQPSDPLGSPAIIWHPQGLVWQADVQVQDPAALQRAGFATGALPKDLEFVLACFSADARHLLTFHRKQHLEGDNVMLRCSIMGVQIHMEVVQFVTGVDTSRTLHHAGCQTAQPFLCTANVGLASVRSCSGTRLHRLMPQRLGRGARHRTSCCL